MITCSERGGCSAASYCSLINLEVRVGTVLEAAPNDKARKPMLILKIDFGPVIGVKTTSAMITDHYDRQSLIGKQVVAATNMPPRNIAGVTSEVLLLAATDPSGSLLLVPDKQTSNGIAVR